MLLPRKTKFRKIQRGRRRGTAKGQTVVQFKLPDPMVTNVCFGGKDLRTAFATLSMTGKLVSFEWPRPGLKLNYLNK